MVQVHSGPVGVRGNPLRIKVFQCVESNQVHENQSRQNVIFPWRAGAHKYGNGHQKDVPDWPIDAPIEKPHRAITNEAKNGEKEDQRLIVELEFSGKEHRYATYHQGRHIHHADYPVERQRKIEEGCYHHKKQNREAHRIKNAVLNGITMFRPRYKIDKPLVGLSQRQSVCGFGIIYAKMKKI